MKKLTEMPVNTPECVIRLSHYPDDPCSWILETWRRGLFGKRDHRAVWFNTRDQAEQYARDFARESDRARRSTPSSTG